MVIQKLLSLGGISISKTDVINLDKFQDLKEKINTTNSYVSQTFADPKASMFQLQLGIVPKEKIQHFFHSTITALDEHRDALKAELIRHNPMTFPIDKRELIKSLDNLRDRCKHLEDNPHHFRMRTTEIQHRANTYLKAAEPYLSLKTTRQ